MTQLQWLTCWDKLRDKLSERAFWAKSQILEEMDKIERQMVREAEQETKIINLTPDQIAPGMLTIENEEPPLFPRKREPNS